MADNNNGSRHGQTSLSNIFNQADREFTPYPTANSFGEGTPGTTNAYTFDNYQEDARTTAIYPGAGQATPIAFAYLCLKLNGEAGEVGEAYAKYLRGDYDLAEAKRRISKELGDVIWYVSQLASELDLSLGDVAANNILKLSDRKERGVLRGSGDER